MHTLVSRGLSQQLAGMKLALLVVALAVTGVQACCPGGTYTGSPESICDFNGVSYTGQGQCYNNFEIDCNVNYQSATIQATWAMPTFDYSECFTFCQTYGGGFTGIESQFGVPTSNCVCVTDQSSSSVNFAGATLTYCSTEGPYPEPPCCELYTGTLDMACVGSMPGNGKCLPDGYQITCDAFWLGDEYTATVPDLQTCYDACNSHGTWSTLEFDTAPGYCWCGTSTLLDSGSEPGSWGIGRTELDLCPYFGLFPTA
jgi:hypothetical protein